MDVAKASAEREAVLKDDSAEETWTQMMGLVKRNKFI